MRVVAVPGRMVRDHVTGRWVDADGVDVDPNDLTWARYLADGDVADGDAAEMKAAPASSKETKE